MCTRRKRSAASVYARTRPAGRLNSTAQCYYQMELYLRRGIVLAQTRREAEAVLCFQQAIDVPRASGRDRWICVAQGRRRAGIHDRLVPVHGWFTEGSTQWICEMKALLDELR